MGGRTGIHRRRLPAKPPVLLELSIGNTLRFHIDPADWLHRCSALRLTHGGTERQLRRPCPYGHERAGSGYWHDFSSPHHFLQLPPFVDTHGLLSKPDRKSTRLNSSHL